MTNPTAAMLVIGDEILSGRTRDSNMHYLAGELTRIGITLREVRVVADVHDDIVIDSNQPKIAHPCTLVFADQDIVGFEVAMNEARLMRCSEACAGLR